ncbi:hypothetical protein PInf_007902 [Phytophthora infestans]|nr:hypothetical protein PInf_007902 [Phytophthora infestans]
MELMSSSEDEGDSPTSLSASSARRKASSASNSQDSFDEELLSPTSRVQVGSKPPAPSMSHKPVISARQLLMSFLPPAKLSSSTKDAKEKATDAAVVAYSLVTPKKPQYRRRRRRRNSQLANALLGKRKEASPGDKKRSFWDAQMAEVGTEQDSAPKSTYVSPFSNPDGFMNMKRRRQRRQEPSIEMSEEELKKSRDAFYDDSKNEAQDVGPRPRHIIGSAIAELDDAEDWMSDEKEVASGDEEAANKLLAKKDRAANVRRTGPKKRTPLKRQPRKRVQKELSDSSEDEQETYTSERWPQLDPPKVNAGPMVLSSDLAGSNTLEVCANLNSYLFDYQREGVEFLLSAYQRDTGAILGDDMGLGKTIQVIAFLSAIMGKHGDRRDKDAWRALLHTRRERYSESGAVGHPEDSGFSFAGEVAPIFIVMPASLLQNWEQELHTWMSCTTIILRGKPSDRDAMIDQIARGEYEIVICSYDILKMYLSRLHKIPWEAVILDEMHCLKNPEAKLTKAVKAITCRKKLGLTGTLMQNNEKELHCLVDTIAPGAIGSWAEFSMYYGQDIKYGRKKSAAPEAVKRSQQKEKELRQKLHPYYLRREKEINPTFQEVKKNDQVVFCDLTPLQMAAYQRILAMPEFQLLQRGEERCDCGRDSGEKRKKCCYKTPSDIGDAPGLLYERFHEDGPCKNCPNCMGLPCVAMLLKLSNHLELLKVNPHEGQELQHYQREFASTAFGSDLDDEMCAISTKTCGKMIVLEKLLAVWKKRRQRTLIFSRSTRMLDIIQLFLITKATKYSRLDGNTKVEERLQMVNDFNSSESNTTVFLISTRAGGVGLNLQSATNVVIFDPSWNPAHDCQAQDRAYRIGQTKDTITLGTIEEMIYVRQIYKQQLSDTTLKGSNAPRYFEGVQGNPQQRGELFGIANLICWKPGGVLKGIQDAYQRSRDGLIIQQNRVQYDAASMKKSAKKTTPKKRPNVVDDDEGEMIEVADELVSDILQPDEPPATTQTEEKPVAVSTSSSGEEDMDAFLGGATTFRHEAIVGEQDGEEGVYQHEEEAAAVSGSEPELEAEDSKAAGVALASPSRPSLGKKLCILSRMEDPKSPTSGQDTKTKVYVPTYL